MSMTKRPLLKPMCGGLLAPTVWRNNALKNIEISSSIVDRSENTINLGKRVDLLPQLRGVVADSSNTEAHKYFRQVRLVVTHFRKMKNEVETELVSLSRVRERMEKLHERIRKDLIVNCQSKKTRMTRPDPENCKDGSDDLLDAEENELKGLKQMVEAHLKRVHDQIIALKDRDSELLEHINERQRVLELTNQSMPCVQGQQEFSFSLNVPVATRTKDKRSDCLKMEQDASNWVDVTLFKPDPVGPYTPGNAEAITNAKLAFERSRVLREQADCLFEKSAKNINTVRMTVDNSLNQRIAETINMKDHLELAYEENRYELNKAKRWFKDVEKCMYLSKGPESTKSLKVAEKLDRPIIKVMQRHPGNQMPDAQILCNADSTVHKMANNIGLLEVSGSNLAKDIHNKNQAIRIDKAVLNLRRSHAGYRWSYNSQIPFC